ncbi:phage protein NinX family protein [Pseudomonas sp. NY15354]|uniref:phage protein NinX family protein n=1 Tax=Pseudomonas sp. NY15354 TaxID=3400351 RepID=UPI003A8B5F43
MTDLIEVKTADLQGWQLAWAVAVAEELDPYLVGPHYGNPWRVFRIQHGEALKWERLYNPHEDWALAGPLIDKHHPTFSFSDGLIRAEVIVASGEPFSAIGPDYLVAACRAIVAAKLGDTVQVPKELMP